MADAKREFWTRLESQGNDVDIHRLWQGLYIITGYKTKVLSITGKNDPPR